MRKAVIIGFIISFVGTMSIYCNWPSSSATQPKYLNLNDTVDYVGKQTCRQCHQKKYQHFMQTGMGQSFDTASRQKSAAEFEHALVYDSVNNFYYKPYWKGDSLMVMEFRLQNGDTVHKRVEKIDYIVGSGQHTNSHIVNINGYLYQAPITFYTQKGRWDLAPGFEKGFNSRFSRKIEMECMTCHNGLPDFVTGSENKYHTVKRGITCERCHGPGELHVQSKRAGHRVDTSRYIDSTIVNPADLSLQKQMSLCKRCHLQGVAVLRDGKSFTDFKPGMDLSTVMNTFIPQRAGQQNEFIMASHVHRLRKSQCFRQSERLSCITCHNPHQSVTKTPIKRFNNTCRSCHNAEGTQCQAPMEKRKAANDNCSQCHMPKSGSKDIPHVAITDHFIRVPVQDTTKEKVQKYLLKCYTSDNPSDKTRAKAYMAYYEKFAGRSFALDSAEWLLVDKPETYQPEYWEHIIHLYFLKRDMGEVVRYAQKRPLDSIQKGWTSYRIGEAYYQTNRYSRAQKYFQKAVDLKPYNLEFRNKLGSVYMKRGQIGKAKDAFEFVISENPKYVPALSNLGYVFMKQQKFQLAKTLYEKALDLNPDYVPGMMNKAGWLIYQQQWNEAERLLERVIRLQPRNRKAHRVLQRLKTRKKQSS